MPHSLSAKKRVRQNIKQREENRELRSRIRTIRRAFAKALETKDFAAARAKLKECTTLLHRAANTGPIHRNAAARIIGRMQVRIAAVEKAETPQK
jgi:small subunit ribosomal protein S20